MPTYTKTLFCAKTGIQLTFIDSYPKGNYELLKQHPQIDNLFHIVSTEKWEAPKDYIAGAILLLLQDYKVIWNREKEGKHAIAALNAAFCEHPSGKLYQWYNELYAALASAKIRVGIRLPSVEATRWGTAALIATLLDKGEDKESTNPQSLSCRVAKAQMRKQEQARLTLDSQLEEFEAIRKEEERQNKNLPRVIERVCRVANKCKKLEKQATLEIETAFRITVREANHQLTKYLMLKDSSRERLASFYGTLAVLKTTRQCAGSSDFKKVKALLLDFNTAPVALDETDWLDS